MDLFGYFNNILRKRTSENFQYQEFKENFVGPFSILPCVCESELDRKYGIVLKKLKNGKPAKFQGELEKKVSFNGGYTHSRKKIRKRILKRYDSLPGFCSMDIGTTDELFEHVKKIYEISYCHYAWAKKTNLEDEFPNYCCGSSSRNVFLTLMDKGYPNASLVYNSYYDHSYVALPFLLREIEDKGFILADPTSDQLFKDMKHAPRNNLFVVLGDKWVYETDWKSGHNLYPSPEDSSSFANLHTLRAYPGNSITVEEGIKKYFRNVFDNPVRIRTDDL